jgi:very-short-patch-repair endonuclease
VGKGTQRLQFAKQLRSNQTGAEHRLWYHLRGHRFLGLKFKRQKPIGPYIVDFVCMEHHLVIEVDGGQHDERHAYDDERDEWLSSQGFTVLRFWNNDVLSNTDAALQRIQTSLSLTLSRMRERELHSAPAKEN